MFSIAAITDHHKCHGLKQNSFVIYNFYGKKSRNSMAVLCLESHKGEMKVSAGLCSWCLFLAGSPSMRLETIHTAWLWTPSIIFIVSASSAPSHALNHSCFFHLYISLPFCLPFPSLKGPYSCTGHAQIIQGTLAKVCELLSLCRVPLSCDNIFSGSRD